MSEKWKFLDTATAAELTDEQWRMIRQRVYAALSPIPQTDRNDAAQDAMILLADLVEQKPLRLAVYLAPRRVLDHCTPCHHARLDNGKRRKIRGSAVYRPMSERTDAAAIAQDDADGLNQPRDWQGLSYGEIVEAGLVSAGRTRLIG